MGAFLDKPKTDKATSSGDGNGIKYGISAMQGWRMEMEDAHVCHTSLPFGESYSFFGVFDGHAGPKVADFCSNNLLDSIIEAFEKDSYGNDEKLKAAIWKGFLAVDTKLMKTTPWSNGTDHSGTTAIVSMITPEHIIFGNCGDSRGLLCRDNQLEYATADHKPYNQREKDRIEKAGGTVMMQRVNGSLAVSRALGDFDYKQNKNMGVTEQLVSPEPDIELVTRNLAKDQFLLLACDGIFDVMSNEEVIEYILYQLELKDDLADICSSLIDLCLGKNSRDNMSVILVTFPGAPVVSQEEIEKDQKVQAAFKSEMEQKVTEMVKAAQDPIELDEHLVMDELKDFKENKYVLSSNQTMITEFLLRKKKEKFGNLDSEDFSEGAVSDPADAVKYFNTGDEVDISENKVSSHSMDTATTVTSQPVTLPSDKVAEDEENSKMIM